MGTFRDEYAPTKGDIIYGKQKARTEYQRYMLPDQLDFVTKDWAYFDNYNENFGISKLQNYQTDSPDGLEKSIHDAPKIKPGTPDLPAKLLGSRLSPVSVFDKTRTPQDRLAREKQDSVFNSKKGTSTPRPEPEALASARYMLALRRACKFGIAFVATNDAFLSQGAKIRFLLDGLDMGKVATKETLNRKGEVLLRDLGSLGRETIDSIYVPITTSELRYTFRHWDELQKVVYFYVAGNSVEPPWQADYTTTDCFSRQFTSCQGAWAKYGVQRSTKPNRHTTLL